MKAMELEVGRGLARERGAPHVAVLFYRIGPYHFARLKSAAARLRVTAVEFSDIDPTYAWEFVPGQEGFERVTLFRGERVEEKSAGEIFAAVEGTLDRVRPEAVAIPGWYD